jgi:thiol-disulfide isomerase/thioredoxin
MKKVYLFMVVCAGIVLFGGCEQKIAENAYVLKGETGIDSPAKVYLVSRNATGEQRDSAVVKNGKFVFKGEVSKPFWASWCGPCRQENPNVVKAFHTFKDKGFTILGVSLDSDKGKWIEAIAADKLEWPHVSDIKGWGNEAAVLYGVRSIPSNFLLNKEGKIVAKNLRGKALEKTLGKYLN